MREWLDAIDAKHVVKLSATLGNQELHYDLPIRKSIESGRIVDYMLHLPAYSSPLSDEDVVWFLIKYHRYTHVLLYCNTVERASGLSDALNAAGIICGFFDGTTDIYDREEHIKAFSLGRVRCLCTVNVINEGINISICNTIVFIEPRWSSDQIVQCIGRGLRDDDEKLLAHIVFPVYRYADAIKFLKAVATRDHEIYSAAASKSSRISVTQEDRYAPATLLGFNIHDGISLAKDRSPEARLKLLSMFKDERGRGPTRGEVYLGFGIGDWVFRRLNSEKTTEKQKADIMSIIGSFSPSTVNRYELAWREKLNVYIQYLDAHGGQHPAEAVKWNGVLVGHWAHDQRTRHNKMSSDRIEALESIPGWKWSIIGDAWDQMYALTTDFISINQRLPKFKEEHAGKKIGYWLSNQKKRLNANRLSADQAIRINSIL